MATIINNSYFVGDNALPNTDDSKSEWQYYIEMTAIHEDNYLVDFLGYKMAKDLNISITWFHGGDNPHYDIPKRRIEEIQSKCTIIRPREILKIIKNDKE